MFIFSKKLHINNNVESGSSPSKPSSRNPQHIALKFGVSPETPSFFQINNGLLHDLKSNRVMEKKGFNIMSSIQEFKFEENNENARRNKDAKLTLPPLEVYKYFHFQIDYLIRIFILINRETYI